MCGIAGIVDYRGGVRAGTIERMSQTLFHRGPDDGGVWIAPREVAGLGHRRLSILDLSENGHQPMCDRSGRVAIAYNGEVYNFRDLRRELQGQEYSFHSDTDTEVILNAYLAWGIESISRLEGMFAIAIFDAEKSCGYLVRDRLGIKPLFYSLQDGRLVFGSEIRAVLASECVGRDLSPEAAYDFFSYGYVPTPATIYKSISKLPPAHILKFSADENSLRRYWDVRFESLDDDPATAEGKLLEHIDRSVEDYLVADVATGSYLSGGVDSSVVTRRAAEIFSGSAASSHRLGGSDLHTFTIGFDVAKHSELDYARKAADLYGTVHAEQVITRETAHDTMDTIVNLFDEPFAASSTIPMLSVARLARSKVTVALCGEGGDETFGGYSWYTWWCKFRQGGFWSTPTGQIVRRALEGILRRRKRKWRLPALESVDLYAQLMGAVTAEDKRMIFSPDLNAQFAGRDNAAYFRKFWRDDLPPMARMQYLDLMTFLPDLNLTRADRTSMNVSLELRVPLLNHYLVEYACGLRQGVRNPDGQLKGLFKKAVWNRLPEVIRHRKKKGFSAPVKQWFSPDGLARLVRDLQAEQGDIMSRWFHPNLECFARKMSGSRAYKLWVMLCWLRKNG